MADRGAGELPPFGHAPPQAPWLKFFVLQVLSDSLFFFPYVQDLGVHPREVSVENNTEAVLVS